MAKCARLFACPLNIIGFWIRLGWLGQMFSSMPHVALADAQPGNLPTLHCLTYANTLDPRLSLPMATAEKRGFYMVVVGYGLPSDWAYGLAAMANLVRDYIFNHTHPDDVVLFVDAFDIIFQGTPEDILTVFLRIEEREQKSLVYSTDPFCSSPRVGEYPATQSPWKFLNCGIYIGRSSVLRVLYQEPVPTKLLDKDGKPDRLQNWHTNYFLDHQDRVALDTECELAQVVFSVTHLHINTKDPDPVSVAGSLVYDKKLGKVVNVKTGTVPPILHFPGQGHWPDATHPERMGTCTLYEVLREIGHPQLARLLESRVQGKYFGLQPWKQMCARYSTLFDQTAMKLSGYGDRAIWLYYRGGRWWWQSLLSGAALLMLVRPRWRRRILRCFSALLSLTKALSTRCTPCHRSIPTTRVDPFASKDTFQESLDS
eukprot:6460391-Amphidinium_carterae.1